MMNLKLKKLLQLLLKAHVIFINNHMIMLGNNNRLFKMIGMKSRWKLFILERRRLRAIRTTGRQFIWKLLETMEMKS